MDARKLETLRILEGGRYNVNIRRITNAETALVHPVTADVSGRHRGRWNAHRQRSSREWQDRRRHVASAESRRRSLRAPAGVPHGVSGVTGSITWLNIRFDTNYDAAKP